MFIGEKIRELRLEHNLLQRELAAKIHIAANTLSQFESGKANPSYEVLTALADFFECSTDYLLSREDDFGNISIPTQKNIELPPDEKELLELYKTLDPLHKKQVLGYVQATAQFAHPNKNTFITRKNK